MGASIADIVGEELPEKLKHEIEVGNVYRIPLSRKDGLHITDPQQEELSKYFIVIGFDTEGNIYGGLLISSDHPRNVPHALLMYQYSVKVENNTFLKWDSWVNCTKIYKSSQDKLTINNFLGCLDDESLYYIISAILDVDNPVITNKERKRYNIQLPEDPDSYF
jgi:hypothetical protein